MRPAVHHHRIIKDKSADAIKAHPGGLLQPLPHASHHPSANHGHQHHHMHHAGAILPGLPRIDTGSEREQVSQLHKRIKELEKENFQLNHHVQQAEQSLRNYRELMANNLNKNYDPATKNENKPNGSTGNVQQQQNQVLQQQVQQLEAQLKDSQKQVTDLTKQKSTFQTKLDDYLKQIREIDQIKQDYATLKQSHIQKEQDVKRLQDELHKLQLQANNNNNNHAQKKPQGSSINSDNLKHLMKVVHQLKIELSATKRELNMQSSNMMQSAINDVSQIYERCNESNFFWKDVVQKKTSELIVMKVETEKERRDMQEEILRLQQHIAQLTDKDVMDMNVGTSPEKSLFSTPAGKNAVVTGIAVGTTPAPYGNHMGTMMTPLPQKTPAPLAEKREVFCSPLLDWKLHELNEESMKKKMQAYEVDIGKLKRDVDAANITIRFYHDKLQNANKAVASLQEVHEGEVKAIKHLAHIKELIRVAKEREQVIDKDRLALEIKQMK